MAAAYIGINLPTITRAVYCNASLTILDNLGIYLKLFYGKSDLINTVGIMENAMAPMMTAAIISAKYNLNPKLGNALVTIGVPISFLTILLWKLILV